ncbi:DUF2975 domain-containing protein [Psychroserpens burtonensis]|uniref:DUF2975 domain-containing protein n=1 Tax=Psychroserpens burtonensis TaxID=49278 RepID=A0A5C7B737_9FLAO|nr:DUF2975 domain-containing protein [Psychroserpens burtonensis]TXE17815.1 DUF2975 domain-containing protein [Psychroserpens burtonensis]
MKKIKFLDGFVLVLIVIYFIQFMANFYLVVYPPDFMNFPKGHELHFVFGYYTQFVSLAFSVISFTGLFFVKSGLGEIIRSGFFNSKSATKFKTAGKLFLVSGFLNMVFNMVLLLRSEEILFLGETGQSSLLVIIGFSLYIISDILENGNLLKQENDLTI